MQRVVMLWLKSILMVNAKCYNCFFLYLQIYEVVHRSPRRVFFGEVGELSSMTMQLNDWSHDLLLTTNQ